VIAIVVAFIGLSPAPVHADAQVSARLAAGAGAAFPEAADTAFLFELALRSELLFGEDAIDVVRVGPAIDVRTGNFESFEGALGATLLLPVAEGWPLWLTAGLGARARANDDHAAFALATLAFGFRPYNYLSAYGFGLGFYASARADLDATPRYELTAGVEIDLEFLVVIPAMFVYTWLSGGDPDEPE
jgi:hypothetical protein